LSDVGRSRVTQRQSRKGQLRVALVGYTNAGKSSILRALSGANDVFVEDRLFATLDPLTRDVDLGGNTHILLTDTVGFIRKLPHHLVASFRATLEEVNESDLLLHVIDGSHPEWDEQRRVVEDVLAELGASDKPVLDVFNKVDALGEPDRLALETRVRNLLPGAVFVSATTPGGLGPLRSALMDWSRTQRPLVRVDLPSGDGKLLAELHREAEVVAVRTEGDHVVVDARVDAALAGRLRRAGAQLVQP
jgi:GTPase